MQLPATVDEIRRALANEGERIHLLTGRAADALNVALTDFRGAQLSGSLVERAEIVERYVAVLESGLALAEELSAVRCALEALETAPNNPAIRRSIVAAFGVQAGQCSN